ncbi:MAG: hypothetical protein IPJ34_38790 [Myxococcales bacterium]|nr:hypothetical protein [Myxococcales bacterium]
MALSAGQTFTVLAVVSTVTAVGEGADSVHSGTLYGGASATAPVSGSTSKHGCDWPGSAYGLPPVRLASRKHASTCLPCTARCRIPPSAARAGRQALATGAADDATGGVEEALTEAEATGVGVTGAGSLVQATKARAASGSERFMGTSRPRS